MTSQIPDCHPDPYEHALEDLQSDLPDHIVRNMMSYLTEAAGASTRVTFENDIREALASAELLAEELTDILKRARKRVV